MLRRTALGMLVATILVAGAAAASAAKGGGQDPAPSSIALNQSNPYLGETVTFATTYPNTVKDPRIVVTCYQNGVLVWSSVGTVDWAFKLGGDSSPWLDNGGGPASCTATLDSVTWHRNQMQEWVYLEDTNFAVTG